MSSVGPVAQSIIEMLRHGLDAIEDLAPHETGIVVDAIVADVGARRQTRPLRRGWRATNDVESSHCDGLAGYRLAAHGNGASDAYHGDAVPESHKDDGR